MSEVKITAERRTAFGKGAARRVRRDHKVPAVLYGHGQDPVHVALPGHETMLALKNSNALLEIALDGDTQLALPKDVQRDPVKGHIEHVDLLVVRRGERVTVELAVHVVGDAAPETMVTLEHQSLQVEAEATAIPSGVEVSVEGATPGTQIHAAQVDLPAGVTLITDPDALVVNVTAAITAEALDAELAEAEAEAGIERDESDADQAAATEGAAPGGEAGADGPTEPGDSPAPDGERAPSGQ